MTRKIVLTVEFEDWLDDPVHITEFRKAVEDWLNATNDVPGDDYKVTAVEQKVDR